MRPLLSVDALSLRAGGDSLVHDLSFCVEPGERVGLIGESGSGKSLTAMAAIGLLPRNVEATGSILLDGQQVMGVPDGVLNSLRGAAAAVVFQEPSTALDPLMKIGSQIAEPLKRRLLRDGQPSRRYGVRGQVLELLGHVLLPEPDRIASAYPHEISGGQRQRVAIAMALACRPKLLIADEPTTALDVTTQAEILTLLDGLVGQFGMALLFISHDLPVVATVVDRVVVLRHGRAVEQGPVKSVFGEPRDDYTKVLVAAARSFDRALGGTGMSMLEIQDLSFGYGGGRMVLDGVSFAMKQGVNVGLVGESGSGKTTLLRLLLGLARPTGGSVRFKGAALDPSDRSYMRSYRRSVQTVFQDPYSSLDPRQKVVDIISEPLRSLGIPGSRPEAVAAALESVGLPADALSRYPHEFSGGQRQRIAIARAIVSRPQLLLADEAVSALDLSTRIRIVDLFKRLSQQMTLLFISHDLSVVAALCQEIAILEQGRIVESGRTRDILAMPQHPYTKRLLASIPRMPA